MMRLDKFIASLTDYSRSEVKRLIKKKHITVNDAVASQALQPVDEHNDEIRLYGEILSYTAARYFMLHKPQGTVSANTDSEHPTVIDLLHEPNTHLLQIAGRLDKDTTGLVLLTDDGQWNHKITSPRSHCSKTYKVTLDRPLTPEAQQQLEQGVQLHQEKQPTKPAIVERLGEHSIRLSIQEGKYHQVKRMLAAVGNHVQSLHREKIGGIVLDEDLPLGEYRPLSPDEILSI